MEVKNWSMTPDGGKMLLYTLRDAESKLQAVVSNFGGVVYALDVPMEDGTMRDVVLGHESAEEYFESGTYYGTIVARCANRIGRGQFTLNGTTYNLDKNDGNNTNHSGRNSLARRLWQTKEAGEDHLVLFYDSPDKDMGFPGAMQIEVAYTLRNKALIVDYHAVADQDTVFNPTSHSYFNLKGHGNGDVMDHSLVIYADQMTFANEESLPDGTIREVDGTPFDFRQKRVIGEHIDDDYDMLNFAKGYDHNFVLRKNNEVSDVFSTKECRVTQAATLFAPDDSLVMDVYTDCPGLQIYTGNFIPDQSTGKNGVKYPCRGGIALETQFYPNAVNIPEFPQPVIRKGEEYLSRTVYRFR